MIELVLHEDRNFEEGKALSWLVWIERWIIRDILNLACRTGYYEIDGPEEDVSGLYGCSIIRNDDNKLVLRFQYTTKEIGEKIMTLVKDPPRDFKDLYDIRETTD